MNFVPDTEVMENGTRYSPDSMSGHNKWGDTFDACFYHYLSQVVSNALKSLEIFPE